MPVHAWAAGAAEADLDLLELGARAKDLGVQVADSALHRAACG